MTLLEVDELASYWAEHPPVHLLLAAYLGVGKDKHTRTPGKSATRPPTDAEPSSVLASLGRGFAAGNVHAGLAPVVLDFAELRRRAGFSD
jgi:hypothetical protein